MDRGNTSQFDQSGIKSFPREKNQKKNGLPSLMNYSALCGRNAIRSRICGRNAIRVARNIQSASDEYRFGTFVELFSFEKVPRSPHERTRPDRSSPALRTPYKRKRRKRVRRTSRLRRGFVADATGKAHGLQFVQNFISCEAQEQRPRTRLSGRRGSAEGQKKHPSQHPSHATDTTRNATRTRFSPGSREEETKLPKETANERKNPTSNIQHPASVQGKTRAPNLHVALARRTTEHIFCDSIQFSGRKHAELKENRQKNEPFLSRRSTFLRWGNGLPSASKYVKLQPNPPQAV